MSRRLLGSACLVLIFTSAALAQNRPTRVPLDARTTPVNVTVKQVTHQGRRAVRVTDDTTPNADVDRLVILPDTDFQDGTIELELTGDLKPDAPEGSRGFVGLAFRVASDPRRYECFYLRPTNGRADDQVRRNHSAQYIAHPDWPWQRLRKEFPEKYESYVDLVAGEWTKVKIEVSGTKARLYVHGATQPTLVVNDLKHGEAKGGLALWIGPGTVAHFANLRVTPGK